MQETVVHAGSVVRCTSDVAWSSRYYDLDASGKTVHKSKMFSDSKFGGTEGAKAAALKFQFEKSDAHGLTQVRYSSTATQTESKAVKRKDTSDKSDNIDENPSKRKKQHPGKIGDEAEEFIFEMMLECPGITALERTNCGDKFDLKWLNSNGQLQGLQVKQLTIFRENSQNIFYSAVDLDKLYKPDTLIVCVNPKDKKAALLFAKDVGPRQMIVSFEPKGSCAYYQKYIIAWQDLRQLLYTKALQSTIILDEKKCMTSKAWKEKLSTDRFVALVKSKSSQEVRPVVSHSEPTDLRVGDKKLQLKSSSGIKGFNACAFSLGKQKAGIKNQPYDVGDNHYYVFEILRPDLQGKFFIISEGELLQLGLLKSDTCKGKTYIPIYPPTLPGRVEEKPHWTRNPRLWFDASSPTLPF